MYGKFSFKAEHEAYVVFCNEFKNKLKSYSSFLLSFPPYPQSKTNNQINIL